MLYTRKKKKKELESVHSFFVILVSVLRLVTKAFLKTVRITLYAQYATFIIRIIFYEVINSCTVLNVM